MGDGRPALRKKRIISLNLDRTQEKLYSAHQQPPRGHRHGQLKNFRVLFSEFALCWNWTEVSMIYDLVHVITMFPFSLLLDQSFLRMTA